MARFSIIVPVAGKNTSFEETLASVLRYRPDNCQVIVVHREHYEDPYGLSREVDFVEIQSKVNSDGMVEIFNAGVKASRGTLIGFLRPGVQLNENWETSIEEAFSAAEVASVTPAIVESTDPSKLIAAGVQAGAGFSRELVGVGQRLSSRKGRGLNPLGPTSWGGFYRKSYLTSLDECDVDLDSNYFDLDLALSFAALDFKSVFSPSCVLTCDVGQELLQTIKAPHGCSAQRAVIRFRRLCSAQPPRSLTIAMVRDLLSFPWRWNHLTHALQRKQAARFHSVDEHYHRLLELLIDQRMHLVSPGLHSRVAAQQRSHVVNQRRAA